MLSIAEAQAVVARHAKPLKAARHPFSRDGIGAVLAEDVTADRDSPPFIKSLMDGYAVRSEDTGEGVSLTVVEEITAGRLPARTLARGEAARIMTGAPLPSGADAVVPVEKAEAGHGRVRLEASSRQGAYVLARGEEYRRGETLLGRGTVLGPAEFGLLAAVGRVDALRCREVRVAVIPTGDELIPPYAPPEPGQIRNSNGYMLVSQARRVGAWAELTEIARDSTESLKARIGPALKDKEVLVLSGGVSAGKLDLVPGVLADLGVTAHFHKVNVKPGRPLLFGTKGDTLVFGLPGNPVSSYVCFELFVAPAIRILRGHPKPWPVAVPTPLAGPLRTSNDRPTYHPARFEGTEHGWRVTPAKWFGSPDLRGLCGTNALLALPPGDLDLQAGDLVPVIRTGED